MLKNSELILAASVPLLWGIGFTFAKAGLTEFPPLFLMGLRFSLASLVLVWFVTIPRIYSSEEPIPESEGLQKEIQLLSDAISKRDINSALESMKILVPEYDPGNGK